MDFDEVARRLEELKRLEEAHIRELECERFSLQAYRHDRREAQLPEDRRCPVCKKVKTKSRSWVNLRHVRLSSQFPAEARKLGMVCRSCYYLLR